jgi:hypothetical protein
MRHVGATGKWRMVSMRELPVGQDRSRSMINGGRAFGEWGVSAGAGQESQSVNPLPYSSGKSISSCG